MVSQADSNSKEHIILYSDEDGQDNWDSHRHVREVRYSRALIASLLIMLVGFVFLLKLGTEQHKHVIIHHLTDSEIPREYSLVNPDEKSFHCNKRIIGYFSDSDTTAITIKQMKKLTHAVFTYIRVYHDGIVRFNTKKAEKRFKKFLEMAKKVGPSLTVMVSFGGEESSTYLPVVVKERGRRRTFIKSIVNFLETYQLDGVDVHFKTTKDSHKWNYQMFQRELREKLAEKKKDYVFSITMDAPGISGSEKAFDLNVTLEYVDFINIYSMDYYEDGKWGNPAGPISPLYSSSESNFSVDSSVRYAICKTRQPTKFNIVIPIFARFWKNLKGSNSSTESVSKEVELNDIKTEVNAYMSRSEIERRRMNLTNATWDEGAKSSYIYNKRRNTYLTFETERSLNAKLNYVKEINLGGVWIWSIEMDDGKRSLQNTVASDDFCSHQSKEINKNNC